MKTVLEKAGDRILRAVLPKTEANACYTLQTSYGGSTDDGKISMYNLTITCTSEQGCHYYGPSVGVDYETWNGYC